jgi:putative membrane protein
MRLIIRFIITFLANLLALILAARLLEGFSVTPAAESFFVVALLLTITNFFLRPILKFFLAPLIFLTLGLFSIIVNASLLLLVDKFSDQLTISGLGTLLAATIVIAIVNGIIHALTHPFIAP